MFRTASKNRKFILLLLLVTYVASAFQHPLQEFLHYLSHIKDVAQSNYVKHNHSYLHENEIDHDHFVLSLIDTSQHEDQDPFSILKNVKKKVEINSVPPLPIFPVRYNFNNLQNSLPYNQVYKEHISPPPKSV